MLTRLVDFFKMKEITAMFTHLSPLGGQVETTDEAISSIMDTWLFLRDIEYESCRSYAIYVLKSRGMPHSHQMREFRITENGVSLGEIFRYRRVVAADQAELVSAQEPK